MMTKSFLFAAAAGLTFAAVPAYAKNATVDTGERTDVASQAAAGGGSASTRYCVVERFTGSRLPTKICKTEREWKKEGVNIHDAGK
jgi:hypothetical protein